MPGFGLHQVEVLLDSLQANHLGGLPQQWWASLQSSRLVAFTSGRLGGKHWELNEGLGAEVFRSNTFSFDVFPGR